MTKEKWINRIRDEEGSGLVLSLMVLLVLSVLGISLGTVTIGSHKLADATQDSSSAYYIAEAGANMAYDEMRRYVLEAYEDSEAKSAFFIKMSSPLGEKKKSEIVYSGDVFESQMGENPTATVKVVPGEENGETKSFTIESIGEVGGKKRKVEKDVSLEWVGKDNSPGDITLPALPTGKAITFENYLRLTDQNKVSGDLLYTGDYSGNASDRVILGWESEYKDIASNSNVKLENYNVNINNYLSNINTPLKPQRLIEKNVSSNNILTLNADTYLKEIKPGDGKTLNVNIPNEDLNIVVDTLNLEQNSKVLVQGKGDLNIFVNKTLNIGYNSELKNTNNTNNINIIFLGNNTLNVSQWAKINGSLYNNNGSIIINEDVTLNGDIITNNGNITIKTKSKTKGNIISKKGNLILGSQYTHIGNIITGLGTMNFFSDANNITGLIISNGEIQFGDQITINGLVFSNGNDINFNGTSKSIVNGALISGKGNISIPDNSQFAGTMIGNDITFRYGTTMTYSDIYLEYYEQLTIGKESDNLNVSIKDLLKSKTPAAEQ